jgi:putative copper export protein
MNGSYIHLLHLIAFGMVAGTLIPAFILDRKLRAEQDWGRRLYLGGVMRSFGRLAPYNVVLLLITGLGNMYNRYADAPYPWYDETWLVIKLACFAVLAFNALLIVPKIATRRAMLIKSVVDKAGPADADQKFATLGASVTRVFVIQTLLLLAVLLLSVFGPGKHPGVF